MMHRFDETIFNYIVPITICFSLSFTYVASLYIWKSKHDRNHPTTIKQRFLSVFLMMFVAPGFLYLGLSRETLDNHSLSEIIGVKLNGLFQAIFLPFILTVILFLGPLYIQFINGVLKTYTDPQHWVLNIKSLLWLRNHVVAPLSEEFTFRSCMLPLLLQCFSPLKAVFICPLFFGVAHFHHMIERIRTGMDFKTAFLMSCFHFSFTTIFGAYSAYLFLRTGHLMSTFIVHAFCNHMGMPDLSELVTYKGQQRFLIIITFILGFLMWCFLLNPLTEPQLYHNTLYSL